MNNRQTLEDAFNFDNHYQRMLRNNENKAIATNIRDYEIAPVRNAAYRRYIENTNFVHDRNVEAVDAQVRRTAFSDDKTINIDKVKIIADNIKRSLKYVGGVTPIILTLNSKEK